MADVEDERRVVRGVGGGRRVGEKGRRKEEEKELIVVTRERCPGG